MPSSLHISLPDELHRFVQERTNGKDIYSTPSEYVRDLIRRDIENFTALSKLRRGMDDFKNGNFSDKSIADYIAADKE
jgi:antitoxin ParD1/3/4